MQGRDQIRRYALWRQPRRIVEESVAGHRTAGPHHWHQRHHFDAAGDDQIGLPSLYFRRGHIDGLQPGAAESGDRRTWHLLTETGGEHRRARDIGALIMDALGTAENDVLELRRIEAVSGLQRAQCRRHQMERRQMMQRAVLLALAARGPNSIENKGLCAAMRTGERVSRHSWMPPRAIWPCRPCRDC